MNSKPKELEIKRCSSRYAQEHRLACEESADSLSEFLYWGSDIESWSFFKHLLLLNYYSQFPEPYESYVVLHEKKVVGFFSYGPAANPWGVQICYWVRSSYQGKGIASLITLELVNWAFQYKKFGYVEIHVDAENLASRRVPEKLGFRIDEEYLTIPHARKESGRMIVYVIEHPRLPKARKVYSREVNSKFNWDETIENLRGAFDQLDQDEQRIA